MKNWQQDPVLLSFRWHVQWCTSASQETRLELQEQKVWHKVHREPEPHVPLYNLWTRGSSSTRYAVKNSGKSICLVQNFPMLIRFFKALHITIAFSTPPSQPSSSPTKVIDTLTYIFMEAGSAMHFRNEAIYAGFFFKHSIQHLVGQQRFRLMNFLCFYRNMFLRI